jgi:hypothetical protein
MNLQYKAVYISFCNLKNVTAQMKRVNAIVTLVCVSVHCTRVSQCQVYIPGMLMHSVGRRTQFHYITFRLSVLLLFTKDSQKL